jgi:hypothetical protein
MTFGTPCICRRSGGARYKLRSDSETRAYSLEETPSSYTRSETNGFGTDVRLGASNPKIWLDWTAESVD